MRALVVIVVLLLILAIAGWIQLGAPDGDPTIRVDTDKVKQDTSSLVDRSKRVVQDAAENIDRDEEGVEAENSTEIPEPVE